MTSIPWRNHTPPNTTRIAPTAINVLRVMLVGYVANPGWSRCPDRGIVGEDHAARVEHQKPLQPGARLREPGLVAERDRTGGEDLRGPHRGRVEGLSGKHDGPVLTPDHHRLVAVNVARCRDHVDPGCDLGLPVEELVRRAGEVDQLG